MSGWSSKSFQQLYQEAPPYLILDQGGSFSPAIKGYDRKSQSVSKLLFLRRHHRGDYRTGFRSGGTGQEYKGSALVITATRRSRGRICEQHGGHRPGLRPGIDCSRYPEELFRCLPGCLHEAGFSGSQAGQNMAAGLKMLTVFRRLRRRAGEGNSARQGLICSPKGTPALPVVHSPAENGFTG